MSLRESLSGRRQLSTLELLALTLFVGLAGAYVLRVASSFLVPLAIAILLAILVDPIMGLCEKWRLPNWLASIFVLLGMTALTLLVGFVLYQAIASVAAGGEQYVLRAQELTALASESIQRNVGIDLYKQLSMDDPSGMLSPSSIVSNITTSVGSVASFLSAALFMLLYLMFIINARPLVRRKLHEIVQSSSLGDEKGEDILEAINGQVLAYLWLKAVISVATGVAFGLVAFVCGLDFPLVWGFLGFVLNFIPSLGPIVATIPPVIVAFLQFSPGYALLVSLLMTTVQFVSGNIIEPVVLGDRLKLNFIAVLLSIFVWGLIWGFSGMVLAVPMTACLNIVLSRSRNFAPLSRLLAD